MDANNFKYCVVAPLTIRDDCDEVKDPERLDAVLDYPPLSEEELLFNESFSDHHPTDRMIRKKYVSNGPMQMVLNGQSLNLQLVIDFASKLDAREIQRLMNCLRGIWIDGEGASYLDYVSEEYGYDIGIADEPNKVFVRFGKDRIHFDLMGNLWR